MIRWKKIEIIREMENEKQMKGRDLKYNGGYFNRNVVLVYSVFLDWNNFCFSYLISEVQLNVYIPLVFV